MVRNVAVIDLGKTNSKVALVDTVTAQEVSVIKRSTAVTSDSLKTHFYPSLDTTATRAFVLESLSALALDLEVDAITVTTHGATVALIDTEGELALPVLDYEYDGVDDLREEYEQHRPDFLETGSPALPGGLNVGAQLFWQQRHYSELFAKVRSILTWPQYWVYVLTGERFNDVTSLGCHTDLYDPRNQRYSSLVDGMNWHSILPPVINSGEPIGSISPRLAKQTGLSPGTPVFSGIHDSNASLVPHLVSQASPFTVVSTGTWFITMAIGVGAVTLEQKKDTLLNVNARGESVPSARFMGGRERDKLHSALPVKESAMESLLNMRVPVLLMPSTISGTGPYPDATQRWINQSPDNDDTDARDCAVTLYLALMTFECMQLVGSLGPTFVEGPLAHDTYYTQMLAAVTERPVFTSDAETGTSVGAAMLISKPERSSVSTPVDVSAKRLTQLKRYAGMWQHQLQIHAR